MSRSLVLIVLLTFAVAPASSQTREKPHLTTRQEFANSNLLVSSHDVVGRSQLTHFCIRIRPDGRFHRERGSSTSFKPYAETGILSDADFRELRTLLDDPEVRALYQDPDSMPKSITVYEGYQIFEITIVRDANRPQDFVFVCGPRSTAPPTKIDALKNLLHRFETARDRAFQRVPANGCRATLAP